MPVVNVGKQDELDAQTRIKRFLVFGAKTTKINPIYKERDGLQKITTSIRNSKKDGLSATGKRENNSGSSNGPAIELETTKQKRSTGTIIETRDAIL